MRKKCYNITEKMGEIWKVEKITGGDHCGFWFFQKEAGFLEGYV